jgi:hypothetical protein
LKKRERGRKREREREKERESDPENRHPKKGRGGKEISLVVKMI